MLRPWTSSPTRRLQARFRWGQSVYSGARQKFYFRMAKADIKTPGGELLLPFLKFNSTGGLDATTGTALTADLARLRIFEGYFASDGTPVATTAVRIERRAFSTFALHRSRAANGRQAMPS